MRHMVKQVLAAVQTNGQLLRLLKWRGHWAQGEKEELGSGCPRKLSRLAPQEIPLRSNVYEVYATDKDEGLNGAVRYSFLKTAGNRDWEYFTIDAISGLIQTAQRLDRETQAVYSVRGRAQGMWAVPDRLVSIKMRIQSRDKARGMS